MRLLARLAVLAAIAASALVLPAGPSGAAGPAVATSVALSANASCDDASLDLGLVTGDVDTETGLATNLAGDVLDQFSQTSGLDGQDGVFTGYGINASGAPGTIIGSYASIGAEPLSAATAAEWFVLYQCGGVGENLVLFTCFGDLGNCPTTAQEGAVALLAAQVSDDTPEPGQVITVSATCPYPLGGALLLDDGTSLGGDSTATVDGGFSIDLTVPDTVAPGTELMVQVDCGVDGQTILSTQLSVVVVEPATSDTTSPTTTPRPTTTPTTDPDGDGGPTGPQAPPATPVAAPPTFTG